MIKGNNIFWDLDGVLRKVTHAFNGGAWPTVWDQRDSTGRGICDGIEENFSILTEAPELEYADLARECYPLHIVSAQPESWRSYTSKWLDVHFPEAHVKYVTDTQHKLKYLERSKRIMIEDCPNYPDYSRMVLVDRPYNRDIIVPVPVRVKHPDELREVLLGFVKGEVYQ